MDLINPEVWKEFVKLSKLLVEYKPTADVYDLFDVMRQLNGSQGYSSNYTNEIDRGINKEYMQSMVVA